MEASKLVKSSTKTITTLFVLFVFGVAVFGLCGCVRVAGNYPLYGYTQFVTVDNGFVCGDYEISVANKTYKRTSLLSQPINGLDGGTAPRNYLSASEGYEDVIPHIENLEIDDKSVVDARGYVTDGKLYGYVNVFYKTIGYLSAGGNYGVEEISHSVVFEYNPKTDEFCETTRLEKCVVVALNGNIVLYWKDRNYYSYNIATKTETFLVEDKAYDSGIQHQSYTDVWTNFQYTTLQMVKAKGSAETEYFYVYDYSANELYLLNKT